MKTYAAVLSLFFVLLASTAAGQTTLADVTHLVNDGFTVADRATLEVAMSKQADDGVITPSVAKAVGTLVRADTLITGTVNTILPGTRIRSTFPFYCNDGSCNGNVFTIAHSDGTVLLRNLTIE